MSPTYCGSHHVPLPFRDSASGSDMDQGGWSWIMEDSGDSDSDELDHRYYLWSDYDSYFISNPFLEMVYLFHVKKVYTY